MAETEEVELLHGVEGMPLEEGDYGGRDVLEVAHPVFPHRAIRSLWLHRSHLEELLELVKCLQALFALGNLEAKPDLLTKQHLGLPLDRDEEGSLSIHKATYPIGCQVHNAFSLSSHGPPIPPWGVARGGDHMLKTPCLASLCDARGLISLDPLVLRLSQHLSPPL